MRTNCGVLGDPPPQVRAARAFRRELAIGRMSGGFGRGGGRDGKPTAGDAPNDSFLKSNGLNSGKHLGHWRKWREKFGGQDAAVQRLESFSRPIN